MFSPNIEEVSILLRFLGCIWLLNIFVVSSISLILSLFLSSSRFFKLFLGIVLCCFCCRLRHMQEVSRCCAFSGSSILFVVFFLLIQIPYLFVLLGILSGLGLCVFFSVSFLRSLSVIIVCILRTRV